MRVGAAADPRRPGRPGGLRGRGRALLAGLLASACLAPPAAADDDLDVLLEGFDDEASEVAVPEPDSGSGDARVWHLSGLASLDSAFNLDQERSEYEGLAQLRGELRLQLDVDFSRWLRAWKARVGGRGWYDPTYRIQGRDDFPKEVLHAYEDEREVWESFVGGPLGSRVDLRLGRLIGGFGTSETLRVVDLLFPIDNRVPAAADLDDLLLPVAQLRVDAGLGGFQATGVAFLERRFSEEPPQGSSFLPEGTVVLGPDEPSDSPAKTEFVGVLRRRVRGVDLSVLGAWVYEDQASFRGDADALFGFRRTRQRVWMLGGTAVGSLRGFVLRSEVAWFDGLRFANDRGRQGRLHALLGVDGFGTWGFDWAVDLVHRWVPDADPDIERAPDFTRRQRTEWALRIRRTLWRERLALTVVGIALGIDGDDGAILRLQADFEATDWLELTGGFLLFDSGDQAPTSALTRNDRIFLGATARF